MKHKQIKSTCKCGYWVLHPQNEIRLCIKCDIEMVKREPLEQDE